MTSQVLLVEDENKTAELLQTALESEGITVTRHADGKGALADFSSGKFELIVLDLKLPDLSGDEILEKIRALDPYVGVIVYSNNEDPAVLIRLINLGVDGFISKGAAADLWRAVRQIQAYLAPLSADARAALLQNLPDDAFVNPVTGDE